LTERTFTDILKNPQADLEEVVWADIDRRILVWERKGVPLDVICKVLTKCALGTIYHTLPSTQVKDSDLVRDWRNNTIHVMERATYHKNWVESVIYRKVSLFPIPDYGPPNRVAKKAKESQ
jgi:hypothetical protein